MSVNFFLKKRFIIYLLMMLTTLLFILVLHFLYLKPNYKNPINQNTILKQEIKDISFDEKKENPIKKEQLQHFKILNKKIKYAPNEPNEINKLIKQGTSIAELKQMGYGISFIKQALIFTKQLKQGTYSAKDLKEAQFGIKELKNAGFLPMELIQAGFSLQELKKTGFSPTELIQACFSPQDLKKAGYTPRELIHLDNSIFQQIGYKVKDFKKDFIRIDQLEKKGYSIFNLIQIGYSPLELSSKYTINRIKLESGYNLLKLKKAGFSTKELMLYLSVTPRELKDVGFTAVQFRYTTLSLYDFKSLGFTPRELKNAGFTAFALKEMDFSLQELKPPLYSIKQLFKEACFSLQDFKEAGFSALTLNQNGISILQLKEAGFVISDLKKFKFTAQELKEIGYTLDELILLGFSLEQFLFAGIKIQELKEKGYTLDEFKNSGCTVKELLRAGYTLQELIKLSNIGLSLRELKITPHNCLNLNCSSKLIQEFRYSKEELKIMGILINFTHNGNIKSITQIETKTGKKIRTNFFGISQETCLINLYDTFGRLYKTYKPIIHDYTNSKIT